MSEKTLAEEWRKTLDDVARTHAEYACGMRLSNSSFMKMAIENHVAATRALIAKGISRAAMHDYTGALMYTDFKELAAELLPNRTEP